MRERAKEVIKKILLWWKKSAEERDGQTSGRRISAMFITTLVYILGRLLYMGYIMATGIVMMVKNNVPVKDYHDGLVSTYYWLLWAFPLDIVFIGLLWGFITQQGIVEFKNGSGSYSKITETKKTEIKEEIKSDTEEKEIPQ